jgi:hypothetical protein
VSYEKNGWPEEWFLPQVADIWTYPEWMKRGKEGYMKKICFIGVGSIGAPMAKCVFGGGYSLPVCDKSPKALETFQEMGVRVTEKPADCANKEMIIVRVANDAQGKEVVLGPEGFLSSSPLDDLILQRFGDCLSF